MADLPLDRIHIRDLRTRCIVGIQADERVKKQDVIINITMQADLSAACTSDRIEDTVDYKGIKQRVLKLIESSSCFLLEHLAQLVAEAVLQDERVRLVTVSIDKPGALRFADSVAIEVTRGQDGHA